LPALAATQFRQGVATMIISFRALEAAVLMLSIWIAWQQGASQEKSQEKPKEAAPAAEPAKSDAAEKKNPIKPTPENLAAAKKFFGYDCAMCHGASGDGKGDLAASMGLKMKDWRDASTLVGLSDGEMFGVIEKGKGKMTGEGDRVPAEMVWKLVNYVRTFSKQVTPATP
jgi:mono/diheme cytochrome c family protein